MQRAPFRRTILAIRRWTSEATTAGSRRDFSVKLLPVSTKPNALQLRPVVGIVGAVLLICPLADALSGSAALSVVVVTDDGQPLANTNVRLSYQNYSAESRSHELTLRTGENGRVLFPAQYGRICVLQRLYYIVSSPEAGVHASFGQHAYGFAAVCQVVAAELIRFFAEPEPRTSHCDSRNTNQRIANCVDYEFSCLMKAELGHDIRAVHAHGIVTKVEQCCDFSV
jgi:hypothetical protein